METSQGTQKPGRTSRRATPSGQALIWPEGGFQWTPELLEQVPPVRGIAPAAWTPRPDWPAALPEISSNGRGRGWLYGYLWPDEQFYEACRNLPQCGMDLAYWQRLYMQCLTRGQALWDWVMEAAIASQGVQFALKMCLGCNEELRVEEYTGFRVLRAALSCAPDAEFAACVAWVEKERGHSTPLDCQISYLFPEQQAWAEECVRNGSPWQGRWLWLSACKLPVETLIVHIDKIRRDGEMGMRPTALLQLKARGAEALPFLLSSIDHAKPVLSLLERCHFPEILPPLAARADRPDIAKVLKKFAKRWPAAVLKCALEESGRSPQKKGILLLAKRLAADAPECVDAALAACDPAIRKKFAGLQAQASETAEAAETAEAVVDLPDILKNPPWAAAAPGVDAQEKSPALVLEAVADEIAEWPEEALRAEPERAARASIPRALGKDKKLRELAQTALLWLARNGFEQLVKASAAACGASAKGNGQAETALSRLAARPRLFLYAQMAGLPDFFIPSAFRHSRLKTGGALPDPAVSALGQLLAICAWVAEHAGESADEPFSWLEEVRAACTPESLSEFVWEVFEAWRVSGMPPNGKWAFFALKTFGRDDVALRLASRIRQWEAETKIQRVISGMEVLEAIGTDTALTYLDGLSHQLKKRWLRGRAQEKIAGIAHRLGLSADQLADRLVPDLGLDASGVLPLDFGPRQFSVAFDESLKPFVRAADGKRIKDLPKPNQKDDDAKAQAAVAAYKELKKAARAIDSLQIRRLEQAMCTQRRWNAADFRRFFREHPLMRHLARRLVWGVYGGEQGAGALQDAFLVAEDATLADRMENPYALPESACVGIAHRLEMDDAWRMAFAQVFADYEILQPFRQLEREIYTLTGDELQSRAITRFNGKKVAPGSLMGLTNRGWWRKVGEGGNVSECVKPLGNTTASLRFEEGFFVGDVSGEAQTLTALELAATPAAADTLAVSELLRDVDLLAAV